MKKSYFILYLVLISIGIVYLGYRKYEQYQADKKYAAEQNAPAAPNATDNLIAQYQSELAKSPNEPRFLLKLAGVYVQKARETSDASYYNKIDDLTNKAESIDPSNAEIYALKGSVALSRHHFTDALALGQKAISLNPNAAANYGIVVDAYTELGKNKEAIDALQIMVDKRPDYSSFSRIAYAREINGDFAGAKTAIQSAISAGSSFPENIAWGYVELGKLDIATNFDKAEQQFNTALSVDPNYTPAYEQLGKLAFAKGDNNTALEKLQKAFDILPLAQYAIGLGEVYEKMGQKDKAAQYYELAQIAFNQSESGGVIIDMELSVFLSEHNRDLGSALELAEKSYKTRASIYGADALALAYYKNNKPVEAQKYISEALRLGENDPSIVFHAAQIAEQNGNVTQAKIYYQKSLAINPHFSILYAGVAESKVK